MHPDLSCPKLDTPPSYGEFLNSYLLPNTPVIIGSALISSWRSLNNWCSDDGSINWERLQTDYGHCQVTVADCSTRDSSDQRRDHMLFRDVVSLWKEARGETLYVKDWHLAHTLATDPTRKESFEAFYTTPDIFRDDWMNAYYSACTRDDFRFVYVGAAGTFTPLHRDVYTSYSWSTNVCGRKRWWLFPPAQTPFLFRKGGEEHLETEYDVRNVDPTQFPRFDQACPIIVEQGPRETIFVCAFFYCILRKCFILTYPRAAPAVGIIKWRISLLVSQSTTTGATLSAFLRSTTPCAPKSRKSSMPWRMSKSSCRRAKWNYLAMHPMIGIQSGLRSFKMSWRRTQVGSGYHIHNTGTIILTLHT